MFIRQPQITLMLIFLIFQLVISKTIAVEDESSSLPNRHTYLFEDYETDPVVNNDISDYFPRYLEFGFHLFHLDYKEDLTPPAKSTESGFIPGFYASTTTNQVYPFGLSFLFNFSTANENYDGTLMQEDQETHEITYTPVTLTTKSTFIRLDLDLTYKYDLSEDFYITHYAGFSFRKWNRLLQGSGGYDEYYTWYNFPFGIIFNFQPVPEFSIKFDACANLMFSGKIGVDFSRLIGFDYPQINMTLGNKVGSCFSLPISCRLSNKITLTGVPYLEHYEFGASDFHYISQTEKIMEPASKTDNYGFHLGFIVNFGDESGKTDY